MNQIEEFNPPPNPAKITDSRATAYIAEFGYNSWELDALEPSVMVDLIEESLSSVRQKYSAPSSVKQSHAQFLFQGVNPLADRSLGQVERLASSSKAGKLRCLGERIEIGKLAVAFAHVLCRVSCSESKTAILMRAKFGFSWSPADNRSSAILPLRC